MKLVHYSQQPVTTLRDHTPGDKADNGMKPYGLWLSDESEGVHGWRSWCEANDFRLKDYKVAQEITLVSNHNVLMIDTPRGIWNLHETYRKRGTGSGIDYAAIDWARVMKAYDGILITPYQWSLRMGGPLWYYAWDCASGCVWRPSKVIQHIGPATPVQFKERETYSDE